MNLLKTIKRWWDRRRLMKSLRESCRRMNSYTPAQRGELYKSALRTINGRELTPEEVAKIDAYYKS